MGELRTFDFSDEGLKQALDALGTSANAVAGNLEAMGICGRVNEPDCCPVANYLRTSIQGATGACIGRDEDLTLYAQVEGSGESHVDAPAIPTAVAGFVVQFDAQRYPDLIEERPYA